MSVLDVIISASYRVKSLRGTQFRVFELYGALPPEWHKMHVVDFFPRLR